MAIASENEWYKAAYYSGSPTGADGDGYWLYPTQSNSITTADANYDFSVGNVTDVGTYAANPSHYGTFNQAANLWEWNDEILSNTDRGLGGGSWGNDEVPIQSSFRGFWIPDGEANSVGFRVTSLEPIVVPEPSIYSLLTSLTALGVVAYRRRKR